MKAVFLTISKMGLISGYVILVVLLVRRLLSRFPKRYSYLLWSVVFLRLACPVGIESPFSLIPDVLYADTASEEEENITGMHAADLLLVQRAGNAQPAGEDGGRKAGGDGAQVPVTGNGYGNSGIADAGKESDKIGELEGAASDDNAGGSGRKETGVQGSDAEAAGKQPQESPSGPAEENQQNGRIAGQDGNAPGQGSVHGPENMTDGKSSSWFAGLAEKLDGIDVRTGILPLLCVVWLAGVLVFWFVWACSIHRFRRKLLGAVRVEEGVYETNQVAASFVDGIFRPVIYLATGLCGEARRYVLCHERVHIRRRDPFIKAAALFLVSIYWFHPLVWLAFKKMCEDMEMSCDERVVELMGAEIKKEYSSTLLQMAQNADEVSLLAAFGGNEVKSRVKNVLSYRRPKKGLAILLLVLVAAVGIGLGLNPGGKNVAASGGNLEENPVGENLGNEEDTGLTGQDGTDSPDGQKNYGLSNGEEENQDGTDPDTAKADAIAKYASVLNQYRTALEEEWGGEKLAEAGFSIILRSFYGGDALGNIGFTFLDMDGDGELELLIGANADGIFASSLILDLYTLRNGVPEQVLSSWDRICYYLCEEDGTFIVANESSSGAANSAWNYYVMRNGELSIVQSVHYDAMMDEEHPWFAAEYPEGSTDGENASADGLEPVTEEAAQAIIKAYEAKYKRLECFSFADYNRVEDGMAGTGKTGTENEGKVSGKNLEEQLNLILSRKAQWELIGDYLPQEVSYTVTDLDRNGRLELIAQSCQGTGIYTNFYIYEVSEDGQNLILCDRTLSEEYYSQPDIMVMRGPVPMYYNPQTGQRNYIFIDAVRDGAAHYYESQWALSLQDGYLTERHLASMAVEYENAGTDVTTTYGPGEWENIQVTNQEEYQNVADRVFDGWQKSLVSISWFGAPQEGETAEQTQQMWYEKLEEAYEGFAIREEVPAAS